MPVFNERATVEEIVRRVLAAPVDGPLELIIVDDGSTDGTGERIAALAAHDDRIRIIRQPRNGGKGRAIRRALEDVTGDVVLIQDADLELDPRDYPALLQPILDDSADIVLGNRFHGGAHHVHYFRHYLANKFLTILCNIVTDLKLNDMGAGYKVFRTSLVKRLRLRARRFDIDPELIIKSARLGVRIYEVPISYHGRTYAQGKKIGWRDGVRAVWRILVARFLA
ncbi:MAG: glycosyltransferase family 2 protein [Candidatus Rokubacteria bacterium]|nr:glycosyltransferase family 2 protein [Candidatus Rokubacteria bacterium]